MRVGRVWGRAWWMKRVGAVTEARPQGRWSFCLIERKPGSVFLSRGREEGTGIPGSTNGWNKDRNTGMTQEGWRNQLGLKDQRVIQVMKGLETTAELRLTMEAVRRRTDALRQVTGRQWNSFLPQ